MRAFLLCTTLALATIFPVAAQQSANETAAVQSVVDAFHAALKAGDSAAALRLLADDAVFLEGGQIETRAEYAANHLPEDIKFEKVIKSAHKPYRVVIHGDAAWAISTSEMVGTFEDKPVNLAGATLMVLSRGPGAWRIRSIHWSSHRR